MKQILQRFKRLEEGAVTVETSLIIMMLIILTGGAIEAGYGFYQYNGAQQAVRTGARIAATSDPVAMSINTMTGLSNSVSTGQAFPNFQVTCSDETQQCSDGSFDATAMRRIVFGPDGDGTCGANENWFNCVVDCEPSCGNGVCECTEDGQWGGTVRSRPTLLSMYHR